MARIVQECLNIKTLITAHELLERRELEIRKREKAGHEIREALVNSYGYGDEPIWRLRSYDKIIEAVIKYGDPATLW